MGLLVCFGLGEEGDVVDLVETDSPVARINQAMKNKADASGVLLGRYQLTLVECSRSLVLTLYESFLLGLRQCEEVLAESDAVCKRQLRHGSTKDRNEKAVVDSKSRLRVRYQIKQILCCRLIDLHLVGGYDISLGLKSGWPI